MIIDVSKIKFSKNDILRKIKLPTKLTPELAEDVGFHIGDGYMKRRKDKWGTHYTFVYSGDYSKDLPYFKNIFLKRKKTIFNLDNLKIENPRTNEIFLRFQSKALFLFYKNVLNVQESPKKDIRIPKWIFNSLVFQRAFLRGLMDSDGCIRFVKKNYPIIEIESQSRVLVNGINKILKKLEISFSSFKIETFDRRTDKIYTKYRAQISGRKNAKKWMELIGSNNKKHKDKYEKWVRSDLNT